MARRERPPGSLAPLPENEKTVGSASRGLLAPPSGPEKEFDYSFGSTHNSRLPQVPLTKPPSPSANAAAQKDAREVLPAFGASEPQAQGDTPTPGSDAAQATPPGCQGGLLTATFGDQPVEPGREATASFGLNRYNRPTSAGSLDPAQKAQVPMLACVSRQSSSGGAGKESSNASPRSPRKAAGPGGGSLTEAIHAAMEKSPRTPRVSTPRTPPPPSGPSPFDPSARALPAPPPGTPFDRANSAAGPPPGSPFDRVGSTAGPPPGSPFDRVSSASGPPPGTPFDRLASNGSPPPPPGAPLETGPPSGTPAGRPGSGGYVSNEDNGDSQAGQFPLAIFDGQKDANPYMAHFPGWPPGYGFTAPPPGMGLPMPGQPMHCVPPAMFPPSASYGPLTMPPPPGGHLQGAPGPYQSQQAPSHLLALPGPPGPLGGIAYDGNVPANLNAYSHTAVGESDDWHSKDDQAQWAARTSRGAKVVFLADTSGDYAVAYGKRIAATAGIVVLVAGVCMLATYLAVGEGNDI